MSTTAAPPHPVTGLLTRTGDNIAAMRDAWVVQMSADQTARALVEADRLVSQLTELMTRLAAHAETVDVAGPAGATSTATWLAVETQQTRAATHRMLRLAAALDRSEHEPVRVALAEGAVNPDQALVIVEAVDALPEQVDEGTRDRAQDLLLQEAAHHDAKGLRILGKRILDVVDPEVGEAHEAKVLAAEEARALASARLTMTDDGHGTTHGTFTIPTLHGDILRKAVTAIAAPKHQRATHGSFERRPSPERLGRALCELLERIPADALPRAGGVNATVVVTIDRDQLVSETGVGTLDTGHRLSLDAVRRLACEAGILPMVLSGAGEPLDLGRTRRFHSRAQRIAIQVRDRCCTAEGCDAPGWLCHVHHDTPWSEGGRTTVEDGRLLCPRHHGFAHDPAYRMIGTPGGSVAFHRRT